MSHLTVSVRALTLPSAFKQKQPHYDAFLYPFISENAQTKARDRVCCKANTAECRACSLGMTLAEYCTQNPDTIGCFRGEYLNICN